MTSGKELTAFNCFYLIQYKTETILVVYALTEHQKKTHSRPFYYGRRKMRRPCQLQLKLYYWVPYFKSSLERKNSISTMAQTVDVFCVYTRDIIENTEHLNCFYFNCHKTAKERLASPLSGHQKIDPFQGILQLSTQNASTIQTRAKSIFRCHVFSLPSDGKNASAVAQLDDAFCVYALDIVEKSYHLHCVSFIHYKTAKERVVSALSEH